MSRIKESQLVGIIGAKWGDEGKGKVSSNLVPQIDVGVGINGGRNAGHTAIVDGVEYKLHIAPGSVTNPDAQSLIGPGKIVHTDGAIEEINTLRYQGLRIDPDNFMISERAAFSGDYHQDWDKIMEERRGKGGIGTTLKGVGPAYTDRVQRIGIPIGLINHPDLFMEELDKALGDYRGRLHSGEDVPDSFRLDYYEPVLERARQQLSPFITNTTSILIAKINEGKRILFEASHGAMLDITYGDYPYVTSSGCVASAIAYGAGLGVIPNMEIIAVYKAYESKVGGGFFPTELLDRKGDLIREKGHEFGTTTRRPRRIGDFDGVASRHSANLSFPTKIAITRGDILTNIDGLKICNAYELNGQVVTEFPFHDILLRQCRPYYRREDYYDGWSEDFQGVTHYGDLSYNFQQYTIGLMEAIGRGELWMIGTGPEDKDAVVLSSIF